MRNRSIRILGAFSLALLMAAGLIAQTSTSGAIEGRIADASGPIPGVTVEISSPALQGTRVAVSDSNGSFRFSQVPPGTYEMRASLAGFNTVRQPNVRVGLGSTVTLDVRMSAAAVSQEITVTAEAPVVDVTSTKTGASISSETMESLPLARDFYSVAQIATGTTRDTHGTAVYGSTSVENAYIIDGLNTTGVELGTEAKTLNFDFIQEVEILTGGLPAEYGRVTGGVINAITKSGGNEFSGGVFGYVNPGGDNETAADYPLWEQSIQETDSEEDYGFDLGGYIVKDRLWFFGAYNRVNESEVDTFIRPLVIPGYGTIQAGDEIPSDITSDIFAGKLTFRINDNNSLAFSLFGDPTEREGALFEPAGPPSTYNGLRETGGTDYVLRYSGIFGTSWVVNALVGTHHEEDFFSGPGTLQPWFIDNTLETPVVSGGFGFYQNQEFDRDTIKLDVSKFLGNHDIKIGADQEDLSALNENWNGGTGQRIYKFRASDGTIYYRHRYYIDDRTFDRANPSTWQILAPLTSEPETKNTSAYLQDSWRILPNLTFNAGVRWEKQEIIGRAGDTNIEIDDAWAPRVGMIWDPLNNGRSKLYGNYGRFYESIPMDINIRAFGGEITVFSHNFSPDPANYLPDPNAPASRPLGGHITPVDPNLKGQYIDEFLIGYEQEVADNLSVGIKATYRDLGRVVEDFLIVGTGDYAIANPGSGIGSTITFYDYWTTYDPALSSAPSPKANREYTGVELNARKRFSNNTQFFASYLWSELEGNYDGLYQASTGQLDPNINSAFDYADFLVNADGKLSGNREHQLKFYGSYTLPDGTMLDGLNVGLSAYYASGYPLNAYGYSYLYGNWEYYLAPRGSLGTGPSEYEADLHIGYPIMFGNGMSLNLMVDVFNLLDRQSATRLDERYNLQQHGECGGFPDPSLCNGDNGWDNVVGTTNPAGSFSNPRTTSPNPDFLRSGVDFTDPRSIRFGVRLSF